MTNEQAKRILLACRPGTSDLDEPEAAQALRHAEQDPELRDWLREQTRFHRNMREALRATPVPSDLKERILAQRKIVTPIWSRPSVLLAAACVAAALVIAGLVVSRQPDDESFQSYRSRMVGFALRQYSMDIVTNDLQVVRSYLRSRGAPADYVLTPALQRTPVKGGAALSFMGRPVSMVCFGLPSNRTGFMFVVEASAVQDGTLPEDMPVINPAHGVMTAAWQREGKVYLLAAEADAAELKHLVDPPSG